MPQKPRIIQRLLHPLLIPVHADHRFHSMPSTDSGHPKKVTDIHWIEWSTCSGIGGRHPPDSLAAMRRNTHSISHSLLVGR